MSLTPEDQRSIEAAGEAFAETLSAARAAFTELADAVPASTPTVASALRSFEDMASQLTSLARGLEFERIVITKRREQAAERERSEADERAAKLDARKALAARAKGIRK